MQPPNSGAHIGLQSTSLLSDAGGGYAGVDTDLDGSRRGAPPPSSGSVRSYHNNVEAAAISSPVVHRGEWKAGSIVEVFSESANCWNVAFVLRVQPGGSDDVLTLQYWLNEESKNKQMHRSDVHIQPLGSHTSDLPPGFHMRPSESKPGEYVCMDATTGLKYATAEIAWQRHFERLIRTPNGMQTICQVPDFNALGSRPVLPPGPAVAAAASHEFVPPTGMGPAVTPRAQAAPAYQNVPLSQTGLGPAITRNSPLDQTGMGPAIAPPQ